MSTDSGLEVVPFQETVNRHRIRLAQNGHTEIAAALLGECATHLFRGEPLPDTLRWFLVKALLAIARADNPSKEAASAFCLKGLPGGPKDPLAQEEEDLRRVAVLVRCYLNETEQHDLYLNQTKPAYRTCFLKAKKRASKKLGIVPKTLNRSIERLGKKYGDRASAMLSLYIGRQPRR